MRVRAAALLKSWSPPRRADPGGFLARWRRGRALSAVRRSAFGPADAEAERLRRIDQRRAIALAAGVSVLAWGAICIGAALAARSSGPPAS